MKRLANLLMVVGVIVAIIALNLDVTGGDGRIVNMNLMEQRQNLLILGCVGFLAGIVLLVGAQRQGGEPVRQGPKENPEIVSLERPVSKVGPSFFEQYLLKGMKPADFLGRLIGAASAAIIGALVVNIAVYSLGYIDAIYNTVPMSFWGHIEIFYIPVAALIFFTVMKSGLPVLTSIYYLELAACILWCLMLIVFFDAKWTSFYMFSSEIVCSIMGVVVATRFKPKAAASIQ